MSSLKTRVKEECPNELKDVDIGQLLVYLGDPAKNEPLREDHTLLPQLVRLPGCILNDYDNPLYVEQASLWVKVGSRSADKIRLEGAMTINDLKKQVKKKFSDAFATTEPCGINIFLGNPLTHLPLAGTMNLSELSACPGYKWNDYQNPLYAAKAQADLFDQVHDIVESFSVLSWLSNLWGSSYSSSACSSQAAQSDVVVCQVRGSLEEPQSLIVLVPALIANRLDSSIHQIASKNQRDMNGLETLASHDNSDVIVRQNSMNDGITNLRKSYQADMS